MTNIAIDLCELFDGDALLHIPSDHFVSQWVNVLSIFFISNLK